MTPTTTSATLRARADRLRRIQACVLGPISANPNVSDAMKDWLDDYSFRVWRMECALDDAAERLDPWPCWKIADLDRGKGTPIC